jgi:hypothetical protein
MSSESQMIFSNQINYVIIQAGGSGSRMGQYAINKPKCLIPVENSPIILNFLKQYKNKTIIIIGDHLFDVLSSYLSSFCKSYSYKLIKAYDKSTSSGIEDAVSFIPKDEPFIVSWSDIFFKKEQKFSFSKELLVGLSNSFQCRWSYDNGFANIPSSQNGVAGFFAFKNKSKFNSINTQKSFVRGFIRSCFKPEDTETFYMHDCFEVGDKSTYEELLSQSPNHRFFNDVTIRDRLVYKKCIDSNYDNIHQDEKRWYKFLSNKNQNIPKIISYEPLILEEIKGNHAWDCLNNKDKIIKNFCQALHTIHSIDDCKNQGDSYKTYYKKSVERINEVSKIIPFVNDPTININGKDCINPFYELNEFEKSIISIINDFKYNFIHGDCTFSNALIDTNNKVYLIDPRGSFGSTKLYGDKRYDWAKLFYSSSTNYDSINSKKFTVDIDSNGKVSLNIKSNGYEKFSDYIIDQSQMSKNEMLIIVSTIWLSLTGYVKEDVDSAMYSFYKGCELWNQAINGLK